MNMYSQFLDVVRNCTPALARLSAKLINASGSACKVLALRNIIFKSYACYRAKKKHQQPEVLKKRCCSPVTLRERLEFHLVAPPGKYTAPVTALHLEGASTALTSLTQYNLLSISDICYSEKCESRLKCLQVCWEIKKINKSAFNILRRLLGLRSRFLV